MVLLDVLEGGVLVFCFHIHSHLCTAFMFHLGYAPCSFVSAAWLFLLINLFQKKKLSADDIWPWISVSTVQVPGVAVMDLQGEYYEEDSGGANGWGFAS